MTTIIPKKKQPTEAPSNSCSGSVFTSGEGPYIHVDFTELDECQSTATIPDQKYARWLISKWVEYRTEIDDSTVDLAQESQ